MEESKYKNGSNRPPRGPMGRGPRIVEKPKDFKRSMVALIRYSKKFIAPVVIAVFLSCVSSILAIIGPDKLKDLTNQILEGITTSINIEAIKDIGILLTILYVLSFIFNYLQAFIMTTITNKLTYKLRFSISTKINKLPLSYFDKHEIGDTLSRVTNDVDTIGHTLHNSVSGLVSSLTMFVGTIIMMFITNWQMSVTAILASLIGFSLSSVILKKSQKYFVRQQEELGKINGHIEEIYSGHNVVKVYNGTREAKEIFNEINEKLYHSVRKSQFLSGLMQPIMGFIGNFGYVAVCIVGSILANNGTILFGDIVAFMIYIRLFTNPLSQIAQNLTGLQSTAAASERVFEFLGEKEMSDEKDKTKVLDKEDVKGNIEFKNVRFGYNKDRVIIKDFNCVAQAGQKIAIVGPTGAGKTTMVNLLMKFYEIDSGDIVIDGVSTKDLTRENVHDLFVMVLQDTWLFNGTVRENIVYNKEGVSDEEIIKACKTVGVDHYIRSLPQGYDTILGDIEGISAGQKQLITIARAMIENAPFLILDEATSSVDTRTEELVQVAMDKLTQGKTSFIIAHRLSTIKNADLILVMNEGNIVEQGNHDELIEKKGFYADLYNSQFEKTLV
ncbi:MAG: ABC transporter ATP-binding protein [Clostridia bacterium]|nr:ABC transporter ATP-binding protein [Clostridia bacterium]